MPLLTEMSPEILLSYVLRDDMDAWKEAKRRLERLEKCEAALKVGKQAMSEIHAARNNPGWFTYGESAAWQHTTLWIDKFMAAARAALEEK